MTDANLANIIAGMDRIRQVEERELRKLCENPEMADVATAIADSMLSQLLYLCNWETLVNEQNETSIHDAMDTIREGVSKEFERLTGKKYVPQAARIVRGMRAAERDSP